jgi:hypothetical protein
MKQLDDFIGSDALKVLQESAENEESWQTLMQDTRKYLRERGVEIPEGVQLALLEEANPNAIEPLQIDLGQSLHSPQFAVGITCPPGLRPYLYTEVKEVCTRILDAWIPERDPYTGEITGYRHIVQCLKKEWRFESRWVCGLVIR